METGLFLNGKIVASDIKTGTRKDDGVPYARRISHFNRYRSRNI